MDIVLSYFKDVCLRNWSIASFKLENGFYNESKYGSVFCIPVSSLCNFSFAFGDFGIKDIFFLTTGDDPDDHQRIPSVSLGTKCKRGINNIVVFQEKIKWSIYNSAVLLYSVNIFLRSYYTIVLQTFHLRGENLAPTSITDILLGSVQLLKLLFFLLIILCLCRNFK